MSSSLTTLQELAESLHNCQRCPLAKLGRRQVVFGVGNPHASVMFVGEAPGFHEDQKGSHSSGQPDNCSTTCWSQRGCRARISTSPM